MSDLVQKFIEAQLSLKSKAPEPIEPKKAKPVKKDARVVEPEEETAAVESLDEKFDRIIRFRPIKKHVKAYLQELIDEIMKEED